MLVLVIDSTSIASLYCVGLYAKYVGTGDGGGILPLSTRALLPFM